ncbi:MAG: hypothetical protein ACYCXT_13370 [Acidiferrobacteraceae bacterium]
MSGPDIKPIESLITGAVGNLRQHPEFLKWFGTQSPGNEGLAVINNSFIYRDKPLIKTTKNEQCLCLKTKDGKLDNEVFVVQPGDFNSDFKFLNAKSANFPAAKPLREAIEDELGRVGQLVFALVGEIKDEPRSVPVNHSYASELQFDPVANNVTVTGMVDGMRRIVVNQLLDPEAAWKEIESTVKADLGDASIGLSDEFAAAFEKLKNEAVSKLQLPDPGASKSASSFIGRLCQAVSDQRQLYNDALARCDQEGGRNGVHINEVLRIAYNFSDDALKVLQLLVSISDLKAVLLWCTIREHFDVAAAFRDLPWTKSTKKPSLSRYQEIINGARNKAFHNLLAFDRTIESDLHGVSISARSLTLLPAHGRRKAHVAFDYEDRELIEVLTELTLAPETAVSMEFWKRNAHVMETFASLLAKMEEALWQLNKARA